jgi:hypothetical protein
MAGSFFGEFFSMKGGSAQRGLKMGDEIGKTVANGKADRSGKVLRMNPNSV